MTTDLREQITKALMAYQPAAYNASMMNAAVNLTADVVMAVVQPALDAKSCGCADADRTYAEMETHHLAEIARLRADCDELIEAKRNLLFSSTENLTQAEAEAHRQRQRAEKAEAANERVRALQGPPREPSRSTHALHDEPSDPGRNEDMTPHAGVIAMLADKVSAITSEHHLDPNTKDADDILLCACGAWVEDWDMHWAEVAITAMYPEIAKQVRALDQPGTTG